MVRAATLRIVIPLTITFAFGLQLLRLWFSGLVYTLYEVLGVGQWGVVGAAVAVFVLGSLAVFVQHRLGARSLQFVGSVLVMARLIEQIFQTPALDFVIISIGVVLLLWFLPISFNTLRGAQKGKYFPIALLLGLSLDTALRGIFGTIDLSWLEGLLPLTIVLVLSAVAWWLLWRTRLNDTLPDHTTSWTILALGPFLFLQAQVFQNIGFTSVVTGWSLPLAVEMIIVADVLGVAAASIIYGRMPRRAWTWTVIIGLIVLVVALPVEGDPLAGLELLVGNIAAAIGLTIITQAQGSRRATLLLPIALLLSFLFAAIYALGHIYALPMEQWTLAPLAALLLAVAMVIAVIRFAERPEPIGPADWTPSVIGLVLIISMIVPWLTWHEPPQVPSQFPVRVMSYNLHSGFDVTGRFDLEAIAQTIEREHPDIIALQEVSRGWVVDGSTDMLAWLSQRLNLPYIWGPTADALWGNALLSRYPLRAIERQLLPNDNVLPHRGFILATYEVAGQSFNIIVTHLDHTATAKRLPQVQALIAAWANRPATVLVGDLNAQPPGEEIGLLRAAGLIDSFTEAGQGDGFTFYSTRPDRRIDYVLHSPDLAATDFQVDPSTASDHRAVAVTLTLK